LYAKDFEYAGEKLSDYGFVICSFDGQKNLESVSSGCDITFNQVKPSMSNTFNLYSSVYDSPYTATFQICKNSCVFKNNLYLTTNEVFSLQRWLCRNTYHRFKIDQEGYYNIYWMTVFSVKQITWNCKIIGLELTMYSNAPYAYMDDISLEYNCKENEPFFIYSASDEEGYIYPSIEFLCLKESNIEKKYSIELSNSLDKKTMKIKGCKKGEIITIDGKSLTISSSDTSHISLPNDFNYFFPKIFNSYANNKNIFVCNIDCLIKFSYSPIRKIGL